MGKKMLNHQQTNLAMRDVTVLAEKTNGAVVLGGCFQGLGIVRSLGRRGIPVCVIDDEFSIARHSRYTTHAVHVKNLREEEQIIETLLRVGEQFHLDGWVLYPAHEEPVAALSHFREQLAPYFRVPTPFWETTRWAWDKRNTYQLANRLAIPTPRTSYPQEKSELAALEKYLPLVIKPAIKEHFIYATKAKA